ncbi:MAG TPA: hypothetical protein VK488_04185 [Gaiellaceae bacterium]|nr:hypothetical protein [Gaiellaceae bacterium]
MPGNRNTGESHLRSFVCRAGHELRVTERCVVDDLGFDRETDFDILLRHEIVTALRNRRHTVVYGTATVGPAAGDDTLWVLRQTHDHRGATWFDAEQNVVWLCAYAHHRSGAPGDAFEHFPQLIEAGLMRPTAADYEALGDDRAERFAAVVGIEAQALLAAARAQPGVEERRVVGTTQPVGLVVHVVDTLEETYVAVFGDTTGPAQFALLLAALYPDRTLEEWRWEERLPTRDLDLARGEFCLSIVHG